MQFHYEYSSYNSHLQLLANQQASYMDALKSNVHVVLSQIGFHF